MTIRDDYTHGSASQSPADDFFAITPSDTVDLPTKPRAIYVGSAGNLAVRAADGVTTVVFVGVPAGSVLALRTSRVLATGSTAGSLVGLV